MFRGSIPPEMRSILHETVRGWPTKEIYVGCAGNFTVERALADLGLSFHSNDVTIYSSAIGYYLAGKEMPLALNPEYLADYGWIEPYFNTPENALATTLLCSELVMGDEVWLARWGEYDKFLDGLTSAGKSYNVSNVATQLQLILSIYGKHLDELRAGWLDDKGELKHKSWVPFESIFGNNCLPAESAKVVAQAIDKMLAKKDITRDNVWQALEYWAADYIAGTEFDDLKKKNPNKGAEK